jgi:hypothetical protein
MANNALEELTLESVTKDTASCTKYNVDVGEWSCILDRIRCREAISCSSYKTCSTTPVHHGQILWIVARAWSANLVNVLHI